MKSYNTRSTIDFLYLEPFHYQKQRRLKNLPQLTKQDVGVLSIHSVKVTAQSWGGVEKVRELLVPTSEKLGANLL